MAQPSQAVRPPQARPRSRKEARETEGQLPHERGEPDQAVAERHPHGARLEPRQRLAQQVAPKGGESRPARLHVDNARMVRGSALPSALACSRSPRSSWHGMCGVSPSKPAGWQTPPSDSSRRPPRRSCESRVLTTPTMQTCVRSGLPRHRRPSPAP